jgi:hypothetical protein
MSEMKSPCEELVNTFVRDIAPKIEAFRGGFNWGLMFELFDEAIQAVEDMKGIEGGAAKKQCAVKIILTVYDEYDIDIPYLPNMVEKQALKIIIDVVIDGIVAILNKRGVFVHEDDAEAGAT